jgi:hypothetical protein
MSFLWRFNGGGGGIAGTAVDPLSPSGVLIAPSEIIDPGAPVPAGWVLTADGAGGYVASPPSGGGGSFSMPFSHDAGVPPGGTRYLRYGQGVISSSTGFRLAAAATLRGIAVAVQLASATNTYAVEILSDPAAKLGPVVILATLLLNIGTFGNQVTGLAVAIPLGVEIGARIVRTAGAGSGLGEMAVSVQFTIP